MNELPHIFLETHNLKNLYSGFGQYNYHLLKNISEIEHEYNFTIHVKKKYLPEELEAHFNLKEYKSLSRHKLFRVRKKYDLWHSVNQNTKIEPLFDIPYLLTLHDIIFIEKDERDNIDRKQLRRLKNKIKRSRAIVYISEYAKDIANQYLEIPNIPEYVIYNGNPVQQRFDTYKIKPTYKPEKRFLFCIGQFFEMKNYHTLIPMMTYLRDYELILAGYHEKPYGEFVQKQIDKYGLNNRVRLVGKISEDDKHYYLQYCEALVFPSLLEGFGLPPIEAMAYGKPVFLAKRTSLPEIGGEKAFYWEGFDPKYMSLVIQHGLTCYYENQFEYQEYYRKRAQQFDWSTTARQYMEVYKSLLKS